MVGEITIQDSYKCGAKFSGSGWVDYIKECHQAFLNAHEICRDVPAGEWRRIEKQKPENWQAVLISDGKIVTAAVANLKFYDDGRIHWDGCGWDGYEWDWDFDERDVTHWMPTPKAPR